MELSLPIDRLTPIWPRMYCALFFRS